MSDTTVTTTPPTETTPTQTQTPPLANSPEARNEDGSIKDQTGNQPSDPSLISGKEPEAKPDGEAKPEGVPEKYEFKAPEGYELNKDLLELSEPVFKKLGLTQEQGQELINLQAEINKKSSPEANANAYEQVRKGWRDGTLADTTLANNGDLRSEVKQNLSSFMAAIGNTKIAGEFKSAMDISGVGDHPAFVKALSAIGAQFKEGSAVRGAGPSEHGQKAPDAKPPSIANAMYPNLK